MVQAMIKISDRANQILNIVKARNNLRDKSEAIEYVAISYGEELLEPKIKPEYLKKLEKIEKGKFYTREELEKKGGW